MSDVRLTEEQELAVVAIGELSKGSQAVITGSAIAERLGWSSKRVARVMRELEELGVVNPAGAGGPS